MTKVPSYLLPILVTVFCLSAVAAPVFAWPSRGQVVDCSGIHWEMQNDTTQTQQFTGSVTSPIVKTDTQSVKPNEWGVLDARFNGLAGKVTVKASISMGGDTRNLEKTIDCGTPTPTPTPTPSPTPSPSPSPTPSPSPSVTPSPTPCTDCDNHNDNHQDQLQNNDQTVNVTVPQTLPDTGMGALTLVPLVAGGPLGFLINKAKVKASYKKEENLSLIASGLVEARKAQ